MKARFLMLLTAVTLFAALAIPVRLRAQGKPEHNGNHNHHHYKLIDLGTLGGPNIWFCNDPNLAGGACAIQNNRGTVVSGADTSQPNPNYQNPSPLFPPFSVPGDPYIQHAFQWQGGALQDLGALPGGYNSWAQGLSANGLIAGQSETGAFDPLTGWPEVHAVLWKNNGRRIIDLGTVDGGYESISFNVNSQGQVVGGALNTIPDSFWFFPTQARAFSWKDGTMQDLGTLGTGTDAQAYWVNERGQVAGASFTNTTVNPVLTYCTAFQIETPTQDPFLWDNGNLIDLGTLGGTCGVPNALNNRGQVVGLSDTAGDAYFHAFIWPGKNNQMEDLGTLGGCCAIATWLNDDGVVVGGSWTSNDQNFQAFLWKHGRMTNLGPPGVCTSALGINSKDQVVGFVCGNTAAILWENGQSIDLNAFNYPGSGLQQLDLAYNINDSGEIVGLGVPPGCGDVFACGHTFVLTPCDDNHDDCEGRFLGGPLVKSGIDGEAAAGQPDPRAPVSPQSPIVMFQPASLDFGTVRYSQTKTLTTTLTNVGNATLTISSITITGTDTADFSQTHTCGSKVRAGKHCVITVTFKPIGRYNTQTFSADVSVSDNASGSPQTVPLSGTGYSICHVSCAQCPIRICQCFGPFGGCTPTAAKESSRNLLDDPKPAPACANGTQSFRLAAPN